MSDLNYSALFALSALNFAAHCVSGVEKAKRSVMEQDMHPFIAVIVAVIVIVALAVVVCKLNSLIGKPMSVSVHGATQYKSDLISLNKKKMDSPQDCPCRVNLFTTTTTKGK